MQSNEPLLLALAPQRSAAADIARDALPSDLRAIDVQAGRAADYDRLLVGGKP